MTALRSQIALLALAVASAGCEGGEADLEYPWVLALLVVVVGAAVRELRRGRRPALGYSRVADLGPLTGTLRTTLRSVPRVLRYAAACALIVAAARPQVETFEERAVEGIDIFVALDMSGSMAAVDMSHEQIRAFQRAMGEEPPDRFSNAVATLHGFIEGRERDRIGMVVFAKDAYLQFPLTLDYETIQRLLGQLELGAIDESATAIGNALGLSVRGLLESTARSKAIILITDGAQHGGNISPIEAAELAREENILIFPILVGKEGTTMVPAGPSRYGFGQRYVAQDYPVDPELLRRIADTTGGTFYRALDREALESGLNEILDQLERTQMQDVASVREQERYGPFVVAALLLLLAEFLLSSTWLRRFP